MLHSINHYYNNHAARNMRLEELINLKVVKSYISEMGARLAMVQARDVAHDLAVTESRRRSVYSMFNICNELSDSELTEFRALLAIEGMFEKLTDDKKKCFAYRLIPE